MKVVEEYARQ